MGNAPAPFAAERGLFKKQGLDVDVKGFASGPALTQALAAKELDIAYVGFVPAYQWLDRGISTVAIAQSSYGLGSIVVRKDSSINSLADLKGKTIASSRKASGNDSLLRGFLLREVAKLEPDRDVQIVGMGEEAKVDALLDKKVDAALTVEPITTKLLATDQARVLVNTVDAAPKHPWYLVVARADWLKANREQAVKFVRGHVEAVKQLSAGEGGDVIVKMFKMDAVKGNGRVTAPADVVRGARDRVGFDYELSEKEMAFFERQVEWARSLGFSKGTHRPAEIFDLSVLREALKGS
jgi:NitT/TauT family transport system substrate-binding protein